MTISAMTLICSRIAQFLAQADTNRIVQYLCEEVSDEAQGQAALDWLGENRPTARNAVLCLLYDIACYHVGTSCFADSEPAGNQDKWFVSVVSGSDLDTQGLKLELADSLEAAEELAVQAYGLVAKFHGQLTTELAA